MAKEKQGADRGGAAQADREVEAAAAAKIEAEARQERIEWRDKIEAQVVRHERAFDDYVGAVCHVEPVASPLQLHELRRLALVTADNPDATLDELTEVHASLAAFEFLYPKTPAAAEVAEAQAKDELDQATIDRVNKALKDDPDLLKKSKQKG